jgi:hypothetical protein
MGGVLEPCYFDLCGRQKGGDVLGRGPRFFFRGPLWFTVAVIAELTLVPEGVAVPIAPLPHDTTEVRWISGVVHAVLYDDADGHHTSPALVPGLVVHGLGQAFSAFGVTGGKSPTGMGG